LNYILLNFDHGLKDPQSFSVGPFKIEITDEHCKNLACLPRDESITFGWDDNYKKSIKIYPEIKGRWIETARVTIDENDLIPSVIFPITSDNNVLDDLCIFLSFITGRSVTTESNPYISHLNPQAHTDKVVHHGYFQREGFSWSNLSKLREKRVAGQFYNFTMAYQSYDFVARAVHFNNALNVAYDRWNKNGKIEYIKKDIRNEVVASLEVKLSGYDINKNITEDIACRLGNIFSPSAIYKLKCFLRGVGLYPEHDDLEFHYRLKWLNVVRNSVAHTGMLPNDKKLSDDIIVDATSSIVDLVMRINQYYFSKVILKIDDPYVDYIKNLITPYFLTGQYGGRDIFNEKQKDYMERAKLEWLATDF
jgi:hypothetical protein